MNSKERWQNCGCLSGIGMYRTIDFVDMTRSFLPLILRNVYAKTVEHQLILRQSGSVEFSSASFLSTV